MEEGVQRLREVGMLEWIYHGRHASPTLGGPRGHSFLITVRNIFIR